MTRKDKRQSKTKKERMEGKPEKDGKSKKK